jgi:hypothetical protein
MIKPNLWQKLAVVTAALMLMCCMALLALQMRANTRHEQEVVQRLSLGLAEHIAQRSELMDTSGMRDAAVRALFGQLMAVNPSVEVYLLDDQGRILGHDAPSGHLVRNRVDVAPLRRLLAGAPLPILGDDPRSADGRKVFSAAPDRAGPPGRLCTWCWSASTGRCWPTTLPPAASGTPRCGRWCWSAASACWPGWWRSTG